MVAAPAARTNITENQDYALQAEVAFLDNIT